MSRRDDLHRMVDELPEQVLERAQQTLAYCAYPDKLRSTVEQAKRRVLERSQRNLREFAERTGRGYISGIGGGSGFTEADGTHHSSMIAFEDGKDDRQRIIRRERVTAPDGTEQTLTAEMRKTA